ncbi:sugar ABC transporter permease [bacterium]|nr:sugar ABC transporter permease [candidate division CSSED10-310 bacterium]
MRRIALRKLRRRYDWVALLFLLPSLAIIFVFHILPIFYSLGLSLFSWDLIGEARFVGMDNYAKLTSDPLFFKSLWNTLYFAVVSVPLNIIIAIAIAMLLNSQIRGIGIYRTIYFIPVITSVNAVSIVWKWMYHPTYGLLNMVLGFFGVPAQSWLEDPHLAMPCIIALSVWKSLGYNVIFFLTGLKNVPKYLYEAALVDGANRWHKFRYITWPILSPVTYYVLIVSTISSFQVFAQVYMMTPNGGRLKSTLVVVFYLYRVAFRDMRFGYASAIAFELFLMIFTMTMIQKLFLEKRVHYS